MSDCALLTNLSKSCLYKFVSKNTIPYYKNGKRTYFDKDEINEWLLRNRVAPAYEIEQKATNYMVRNRKKRS
ncbi:MAG: helix-turn-helix domain-containing protein [Paludibacter sp.]|nr:helix-turn-helix domain-containing protein [Paludibacter sp.]